jgi:3-oxoacyl-[acyl-carrier protein] reductase
LNSYRTQLQGKVAIVTGGSSGIGRAVCQGLAKNGAAVVAVGRNKRRIEETIEDVMKVSHSASFSRPAIGLQLDVCLETDMLIMVEKTIRYFGRIDILVASAGILRAVNSGPTLLVDTSCDEWDAVVGTNLKGIFLSNRAVLKPMIKQRAGHIINVSSLSGRQALAFDSVYCASKFGVIGLTQALAEELRTYGIRVQVVLPGNTDTSIWTQNRMIPKAVETMPVDRVADLCNLMLTCPEDVILEEVAISPLRTGNKPNWQKGVIGF